MPMFVNEKCDINLFTDDTSLSTVVRYKTRSLHYHMGVAMENAVQAGAKIPGVVGVWGAVWGAVGEWCGGCDTPNLKNSRIRRPIVYFAGQSKISQGAKKNFIATQ